MATIRKRGNKYQVQIRRKGSAVQSRSFSKRKDAEAWARLMDTQADKNELSVSLKLLDQYTVRDILERYKNEVTANKRSEDSEKYIIQAFLRTKIADLTLRQATANHFSAYRDTRLKSVKAGTVNREFQIIKHAFDLAEREWGIPVKNNPITKLKKLKVRNARTRRLSNEEYDLMIGELKNTRNEYIESLIKLAIETGMRRGELLNLRWDNIDFKKRTLFISMSKNGDSRMIPISQSAINILQSLKQVSEADYVLILTKNAAKLAWQRLVKRCGIKDLHFHDLRHEAISRFFENGLSIAEVALISGHKDFRMLFRYTHLKAEDIALKLMKV